MGKYELIPMQLKHEGIITDEQIIKPVPCQEDVILLTHTNEYWQRLINLQLTEREQRVSGFPLSDNLVKREIVITQGTIDCALHALENKVALNVAGGTHHAYADRAEGFCLLNDFAVASNFLLNNKIVKRILIVDLDVHQGNGTAVLFANTPSVFTFSMHGAHNYPFKKEKSDLDIPLKDGIVDDEYLALLSEHLPKLIDFHKPDLIFYLAGVDILETDKLGKLKVTEQGCRNRDEIVFELCRKHQIPVAVSMGGGYSPLIKDIVNAHCNTFKAANEILLT
jgi:acetoin utilization deacetylase AcuC-like enzyme